MNYKTLQKQYKDNLSDFRDWIYLDHCEDYLLFPENIGTRMSIDETTLSKGELYTIVTNKEAKGKKGALIAIIKGTKSEIVSNVLMKIAMRERVKVKIITLDMSSAMDWIVRACFPNTKKVIDRFHTQKLVTEALQEMRVEERWKAIDEENEMIQKCKKTGIRYIPLTYSNGDTKKQLLARGRYLLFKPSSKWTESQKERVNILFTAFPELKAGYSLSMMFRSAYEHSKTKEEAKKKLDSWYRKAEEKGFKTFITASESIKNHEGWILNYFPERETNASAESFNAKLKGFRTLVRGVADTKFFLYRIAKIYG
ncbi:DDE transposase, partial [Candidatus Peregrinibacteria bacterium CG_4_10_14_0_2_um_filter_43_11]